MPLVEVPVPNLLGGVSEQPAAGRLPGQVEACDNALLHVVNGLAKRKGSTHVNRLLSGLESVRLVHLINRDETERYLALIGERRLRIFSAIDGTEFPVRVNGTATAAGRGQATAGTPLLYLDPRTAGGIMDQDEDFVIGAGDWLTVAANSVTSYIAGRGPFNFGRRESTAAVTADTVAEVGNGGVASISDIFQDFGVHAGAQVFSVYAKKSSSALTDFELTIANTALTSAVTARFNVDGAGVITAGPTTTTEPDALSTVESLGHGWYRCSLSALSGASDFPPPGAFLEGSVRRLRIRFHTVGVSPANKRLLLFGARCHQLDLLSDPTPDYVFPQPDLFRALTVADSTFLLNTEQTVGVPTGTSPSGPGGGIKAAVFVRNAAQDNIYNVVIRDTLGVDRTYTYTPTTAVLTTTENIVTQLVTLINAAGFFVASANIGSTFILGDGTKTLVSVTPHDGRGDSHMIAFLTSGGQVMRVTDLPTVLGANGALVKIIGETTASADDYYAKFVLDNAFTTQGGHWFETLAPGITFIPAASTLPQQLRRLVDDAAGTKSGVPNAVYFDVSAVTWDNRLVGDDISNPSPSFVGKQIKDLFLYRGRLGFLADENVILSEAGEVFNFWRTTVLQLPDSDPIDVNAGVRDVVLFKNAVPSTDTLLLFSDRHQFQLLGEPTLTPASAQLSSVRSFENLTQARPADTGRGVVFARATDSFSGLAELILQQQDLIFRFEDITLQAPRYIAGRAEQIIHSSLTGLTVVRSEDPEILYLHQSFMDGEEQRLQSALHRWVFDPDTLIRGVGFIEADLLLTVERAEGWFLETVLTNSEITEGGRPITHLDRRLDETQVTALYDGGTDTTLFILPYTIAAGATMMVVDAVSGLIVPITVQGSTTVTVSGDLSASTLFIGEVYTLSVTLSEPIIRETDARGGTIPRMGRPLNVNRLYLYVSDTAYLEVHVQPDLRVESVEEFSAAGLGTGLLLEGVLSLYTGDTDFAIIGRSTELTVLITNDTPFPSLIESARWECLYRARAASA